MPTCGLTDYGPVMGITHDPCIMELIMLLFLCYHQLVPHWSPISCVLPFLGRLGPACAEVGSGFAVVGLLRRFCLSSHPLRWSWSVSVGLRFSFPLPFQGSPAPGQVCLCWCFLFPSSLAFPLFVSRLSNMISSSFSSHLIFFSFSSSPHSAESRPALSRVCVCVWNVWIDAINFETRLDYLIIL